MTGQSAACWLGRLGAALLLGGCALLADPSRVAVGTPQAQLRQELGAPTATYPAAGGAGRDSGQAAGAAGSHHQPA